MSCITVHKLSQHPTHGVLFSCILKKSNAFLTMEDLFVDPRFEDEALSALMEEAFSETKEETKFDVEAYFDGNIDY